MMTGRRPDSSASEAGLFMLCINMAPRSAVVVRVLSPALAQPWSCLRSLNQAPSAAPLVSRARRGTMAPRLDLKLSLRASTSLDRPPTDERSLARPARRKRETSRERVCIVRQGQARTCFDEESTGRIRSVGAPYSDTVYSECHMEPPETDAERETWSMGGAAR